MPFFSPSTRGFYAKEIHGRSIPADAVKVSPQTYDSLMLAQRQGHHIVPGPKGHPVVEHAHANDGAHLAAAIARVKREARRRILAIATLERQSNDNALIALGGDSTVSAAARERRQKIDAVRDASNQIEAALAGYSDAELAAFDAATAAWPE